MALVNVLLVTSVLALAPLAGTESGELLILATYPDSDNFSSIELSCVYDMSIGLQSEGIGAKYLLNGTDINEKIEKVDDSNGTVNFVLTPEKEGFFTCCRNGSVSMNSIGLAGMYIAFKIISCVHVYLCFFLLVHTRFQFLPSTAQPSTDYSRQTVIYEVELSDAANTVSTELQCDIQPGALRQRYSVQWVQVFNHITSVDTFNLTLTVNSSTNGSQYQCYVTIDHDSNGITMTYEGRLNTVVVMLKGIPTLNVQEQNKML